MARRLRDWLPRLTSLTGALTPPSHWDDLSRVTLLGPGMWDALQARFGDAPLGRGHGRTRADPAIRPTSARERRGR